MSYFSKDLGATDLQGNDIDPKVWSADIFTNGLEKNSLAGQTGPVGSSALIQIDERLSAEPGSTITYPFVPYQKNKMILGNETGIRKNASKLTEFGLPVNIHIVSASFARKGRVTGQRMVWNYREMAKKHLTRREVDYQEDINFATMAGVSYTELEDVTAPHLAAANTTDRVSGDTRCIRSDGLSATVAVAAASSDNTALVAAMNTTDKASTTLIEACLIQALENDPYIIQPIMLENGDPVYVMYFSLRAARDLKRDPLFEKYNLAKVTAGGGNDPFANSSFGQWENVLLKSSQRIISFGASGNKFARNLFCGSEAVINIFGNLQGDYTEEIEDHMTDYSAASATIRGESKVTFNGTDINIIQAITASN